MRRLTTVVDPGIALTLSLWGTWGIQVAILTLRPLHLPFSSKSRAGLQFREGEEEPVPHGQCFMPVRVPFGIEGWSIIVLPSFPTSVYRSMRCHPVRMSSSLDESCSGRFLASSSGASNLWMEDVCICWLVYLCLRLSWFWAFGLPPLACFILAQFIVYAVSAVSWTPVSFRLAWMSAVVAWGLTSSSCASNLWIEWSCVACLGLSSSLDCLGSVP